MLASETALLLIGFQNDYFSSDGILNGVFEDRQQLNKVLENIDPLIQGMLDKGVLVVETPIQFTQDYSELDEPVGILKIIKDAGAFKQDTFGADTIDQIKAFGNQVKSLPGKRGLNCFSNTDLQPLMQEMGVKHILIAGAVTSLCIDTAGREAMNLGYKVQILSDSILARTEFEQSYYVDEIMPLYSKLMTCQDALEQVEG